MGKQLRYWELEYLKNNYQNETNSELSQKLQRSEDSIKTLLKKHFLSRSKEEKQNLKTK